MIIILLCKSCALKFGHDVAWHHTDHRTSIAPIKDVITPCNHAALDESCLGSKSIPRFFALVFPRLWQTPLAWSGECYSFRLSLDRNRCQHHTKTRHTATTTRRNAIAEIILHTGGMPQTCGMLDPAVRFRDHIGPRSSWCNTAHLINYGRISVHHDDKTTYRAWRGSSGRSSCGWLRRLAILEQNYYLKTWYWLKKRQYSVKTFAYCARNKWRSSKLCGLHRNRGEMAHLADTMNACCV